MLYEKCLNDNKDGPWQAHAWDMMVMTHCAGGLRSGAEYEQLLKEVGFKDVKIVRTQPSCNIDVILAKKS